MTYNQFLKTIVSSIQEKIGEKNQILIEPILEGSDLEAGSIVIFEKEADFRIDFQLELYYKRFRSGETIKYLTREIIEFYQREKEKQKDILFETVQSCIIFRLINFMNNKEMLTQIPYIRFLDLAITFHYFIEKEHMKVETSCITKELIKQWGITKTDLLYHAKKNTSKWFPVQLKTMKQVIEEIMKNDMQKIFQKYALYEASEDGFDTILENIFSQIEQNQETEIFVLTNQFGKNGAITILYHDVIKKLAEKCQADLFLLPSSIHESATC